MALSIVMDNYNLTKIFSRHFLLPYIGEAGELIPQAATTQLRKIYKLPLRPSTIDGNSNVPATKLRQRPCRKENGNNPAGKKKDQAVNKIDANSNGPPTKLRQRPCGKKKDQAVNMIDANSNEKKKDQAVNMIDANSNGPPTNQANDPAEKKRSILIITEERETALNTIDGNSNALPTN
ncbi:4018_t:CDS:2 [Paraglomus brasilianum]|uniref:4018_t:CDS:1 n=1 Tax=Paraglomus brasilianum TaxID=144538 RepID=A0A9N9B5I2_9GLOM|nr:4018_t:CDS:2 [Paraglomus brasilianum]